MSTGTKVKSLARDILSKAEEVKTVLLERQDKFVGNVRLATVHSIGNKRIVVLGPDGGNRFFVLQK